LVVVVVVDEELQLVDEDEEHLHSYRVELNELMYLMLVYDVLMHEHIQVPIERE